MLVDDAGILRLLRLPVGWTRVGPWETTTSRNCGVFCAVSQRARRPNSPERSAEIWTDLDGLVKGQRPCSVS